MLSFFVGLLVGSVGMLIVISIMGVAKGKDIKEKIKFHKE